MDTEPVPAPTSYTTESLHSFSLATDSVLTSLLVMGASPRVNASSGMDMEFLVSGVGFSMSATHRSPKLSSRHWDGVPVKILSVG